MNETLKVISERFSCRDFFNQADADALAALYAEDAVNHQVANEPVMGRAATCETFKAEFATAEMTCIVENMFEDGEWAIMEWRDPPRTARLRLFPHRGW